MGALLSISPSMDGSALYQLVIFVITGYFIYTYIMKPLADHTARRHIREEIFLSQTEKLRSDMQTLLEKYNNELRRGKEMARITKDRLINAATIEEMRFKAMAKRDTQDAMMQFKRALEDEKSLAWSDLTKEIPELSSKIVEEIKRNVRDTH